MPKKKKAATKVPVTTLHTATAPKPVAERPPRPRFIAQPVKPKEPVSHNPTLTVTIIGGSRVTFRDTKKRDAFCERMRSTGVKYALGEKPPTE